MKTVKLISPLLALCLVLTGCGGGGQVPQLPPDSQPAQTQADDQPGNLLAQASPETSALTLWYYDGASATSRTLFDTVREQELLDALNALPAQRVENPDWTEWILPCYGLWIGNQDGTDLCAAWSNGLWLDQEGNVWQVETDFAAFWQQLEGEQQEQNQSVLYFPCAGLLASHDERFLAPAEEGEDDGIATLPLMTYLTVEKITDGIATLLIDNQSGAVATYSEYYRLDVERDGAWYTLPTREPVAFQDIAYELQDLEQATVTCDLNVYGTLAAGHYRLVKDDLAAEFWLDDQGALVEGQHGAAAFSEPEVTMEVSAEDLTAVQVRLHNGSDRDTGYLWDFTLWKWETDSWVPVPFAEPYGICGVQDPLPAGETVELSLDFESLFGTLEDGRYRLLMESEGWSADFEMK